MIDLEASDRLAYLELCSLADEWAARLGQKTYPDGTRWIAHTPDRAPEAYLHQIFAPLEEEQISALEDDLDYTFPRSFRQFLQLHNGLDLFAEHINIYGLRRSWTRTNLVEAAQQPFSIFTPNEDERPSNAPEELIFVGSLGDKRELVAAMPDGRVFVWNEPYSPSKQEFYPSVFAFLAEQARQVGLLFDHLGRRLNR